MRAEYTLPELCAELGLSPAWVRKVLFYLGLKGWGGGQRGKRSSFDVFEFEFLRKLASLRRLGFGLEEIKRLYDKEMEIWKFVHRNLSGDEPPKEEEPSHKSGFGTIPVYLIQNVISGSLGIDYSGTKFKQNKTIAEELKKLMEEYKVLIKDISIKADHNYEILKREVGDIKSIAD